MNIENKAVLIIGRTVALGEALVPESLAKAACIGVELAEQTMKADERG